MSVIGSGARKIRARPSPAGRGAEIVVDDIVEGEACRLEVRAIINASCRLV